MPKLNLDVLESGQRQQAVRDDLRDRSSPFFLISIVGEPETVGLMASNDSLTVTMAAQRTNLEYALGAALARELDELITDDWHFFSEDVELSGDDLLHRLKVTCMESHYREASEQILIKIDRA